MQSAVKWCFVCGLCWASSLTFSVYADESHDHQHEQHHEHASHHKAHVHGLAKLMVAVEGQVLNIELQAPADSFLGFEHKAVSSKDQQTLEQTTAQLKRPQQWLTFIGDECILDKSHVHWTGALAQEQSDHHHGDHDHSNETHSDLEASYQFSCRSSGLLRAMTVSLFDRFSRIESIDVMWVTSDQQGAETLSPSSKTLSLQ